MSLPQDADLVKCVKAVPPPRVVISTARGVDVFVYEPNAKDLNWGSAVASATSKREEYTAGRLTMRLLAMVLAVAALMVMQVMDCA